MGLLPETVTGGSSGHISQTNQAWGKLNDLPNVVRDYGLVGDNSTNNSTNLQTAINETADAAATQGRAGTLVFPPGIYRTDQFTMKAGVHLLGLGHPGKGGDTRYGAFLAARANSQRLLFMDGDPSLIQEGFLCENIGFTCGTFTGVTGAEVHGVNRWQFVNCTFSGPSGTPMDVGIFCTARNFADTSNTDMAWWNIQHCDFRRCQVACKISGNGGRISGCNYVPESAMTGEIGIWLRADANEGCQSVQVSDCMFDISTSTTSYGMVIEGGDCGVRNCKFEGLPPGTGDGTGIVMRKDAGGSNPIRNNIIDSHFGGFGGTGNCITVGANVVDTGIFFNQFTSSTEIADSGTRTQNFHNRSAAATWT